MLTPKERRSFNVMTNGMTVSDRATNMFDRQPVFGFPNDDIPTPIIRTLQWTKTSRLEDANTNLANMQVINANTGGLRGVLPCKGDVPVGLTASSGTGAILRRPATNPMDAYYPTPIPGIRHQPKGLLEQEYYCDPRPLLVPADNFTASLNSRLGLPA